MAIKVQHDYQVGNGLEIVDNKTAVKPDNTGNVQFEVSEAGLKGNVDLPQIPVDVKLSDLEFTQDGKLKATLSDNSTTEVDFNAMVIIAALKAANEQQKAELKTFLLNLIKGEEVQDFAGTTKGFLLPTA
ncbi:MAG: hypothetical protein MSA88_06820 [[Pasteurella] aerogenes]|nr:hypothetical protein [[Pasteurella] aerogenes]